MTRSKKPIDEAFHRAVTNALGARSPYVAAREAGLSMNAISRVAEGRTRSCRGRSRLRARSGSRSAMSCRAAATRAARAARLALRMMKLMRPEFQKIVEADEDKINAFVEAFAASYDDFVRELGPTRTGDPNATVLLHLGMFQRQMFQRQEAAKAASAGEGDQGDQ